VRYVIVGGGAAGMSAVSAIRALDREGRIELVQDEDPLAYSRPTLFDVVAGRREIDSLRTAGSDWPERLGVTVWKGWRAAELRPAERVLVTVPAGAERRGTWSRLHLEYDRLLIATGARARRVQLRAVERRRDDRVRVLRTLGHALAIREELYRVRTAVILGGGPLACKMAETLAVMGKRVTMLVESGQLLSRMLHPEGARLVQGLLEELGVTVRLGCGEVHVEQREAGRTTVRVQGETMEADFVFAAKGVIPATGWLEGSGVVLAPGGGVEVDHEQRTSCEGVFAAGDVASTPDAVRGMRVNHGNWVNAVLQGRVAAQAMVTGRSSSPGFTNWNVMVVCGYPVASMGLVRAEPSDEVVEIGGRKRYKRLVLRDGRLVGVQLVGETVGAGVLRYRLALGCRVRPPDWSLLLQPALTGCGKGRPRYVPRTRR